MYEKIKLICAENFGLFIAVFTALLFMCVSLLCRDYLHNNGNGNSAAQVQLQHIGTTQQQITTGINSVEQQVAGVREEIAATREEINSVNRNLEDAGAIIEDCKRILRQVEQRPQPSK